MKIPENNLKEDSGKRRDISSTIVCVSLAGYSKRVNVAEEVERSRFFGIWHLVPKYEIKKANTLFFFDGQQFKEVQNTV
jgi:hypothetical protein